MNMLEQKDAAIADARGAPRLLAGLLSICGMAVLMAVATILTSASASAASDWVERFHSGGLTGYSPIVGAGGHGSKAKAKTRQPSKKKTYEYASSSDDDDTPKKKSKKRSGGVKVASLGSSFDYAPPKKSLSGGGGNVNWSASSGCLNGTLRSAIAGVSKLASVRVNSTCRSHSHNKSVGGAKRSHHLTGDAVDFRVFGNSSAVYAYLRSNGSLGGIKHYGGGLFHVDTGPRRSW